MIMIMTNLEHASSVPSVLAVVRFTVLAVSPLWRYARFTRFPTFRFAVLARTPFRRSSFPFEGHVKATQMMIDDNNVTILL